jgi:drug/metabolite transporter (DMT)-like permease
VRRGVALPYAGVVLIWGTTWLAITFQLGRVDPLVSVFYRFGLASGLTLALCAILRLPLRFRPSEHAWIALQGICLFSAAYWMVYAAEGFIASGLAAVVSSSLILANILFSRLLLKKPLRGHVLSGALLGMAGIVAIFLPELRALSWSDASFRGLALCTGSTVIFSVGNIVSERNQRKGMPVLPVNGLAMGYGAGALGLLIAVTGKTLAFDPSIGYAASLVYLSVLGSIAAFWLYLTLVGRIGADRAAYGPLVVPVLALLLSTAFEGYRWTPLSAAGIVLIAAGNLLILRVNISSRFKVKTVQ